MDAEAYLIILIILIVGGRIWWGLLSRKKNRQRFKAETRAENPHLSEAQQRFIIRTKILKTIQGIHCLNGLNTRYSNADKITCYHNSERFNNRFLETHFNAQFNKHIFQITGGGLIFLTWLMVWEGISIYNGFGLSLGSLLFSVILIPTYTLFVLAWIAMLIYPYYEGDFLYKVPIINWALKRMVRATPLRYNRQAQVVHVLYQGKQLTLFWKDVVAFDVYTPVNVMEQHRLLLVFPGQPEILGHNDPIEFSGWFYTEESVRADTTISRWEHLRRYMEEGLEAINNPEGDFDAQGQKNSMLGIIMHLGLTYLITHYIIDRRHKNFKWNDEIQALCAPDAKEKGLLDNYDTTPIKATKTREIVEMY